MKLAKWEDRGHYAQKLEAEKAQRQLHKMVRDAQGVLARPAAAVIGACSAAMGFADLSSPNLEAGNNKETRSKPRRARPNSGSEQKSWQDQVQLLLVADLIISSCHACSVHAR